MKPCSNCGITKQFDDYHKDRTKKDGLSSTCKSCAIARTRKDYKENKSKRRKQQAQYRVNNIETVNMMNRKYYHRTKGIRKLKLENDRLTRMKYLCSARRSDAKKKNLSFEITPEILLAMLYWQGEKCIVTGIPFDYSHDPRYLRSSFGPSVDRIDSTKGYTLDNIRLVCFIVNMGKADYPQETFDEMCIARARKLGYEKT